MTRTFSSEGTSVAVTRLLGGPCVVTQVKNKEKDGYTSIQLGFGEAKSVTKSLEGHFKKAGKNFKEVREFRVEDGSYEVGQILDVSQFAVGDSVVVTGTSKGRGFQGVVKRHHFHGHPSTHGHKDQARMPGAISAGGMQHVRKGTRMAGRMGNDRVTLHNLKVVEVNKDTNELVLSGAVPGARNGVILVIGE